MSGQGSKIKSSLKFIDYYVNSVEFYANLDFEDKPVKVDFSISKDIEYVFDEKNTILVTLKTKVFENAEENNYPFQMNVNMTGIFEIDEVDKENKNIFAEVNAVAILFPYVRSIITTYTANANIEPLILPPINVVKLMKDKQKT